MAKDSFKVKKSLNIKPTDPATLSNSEVGDIVIDSTDNNKLKTYNDSSSSFVSVSSVGSLDTLLAEDFETTLAADFISGNAASPDTVPTGSFGGSLTDETSNQLSGVRSLKYTMNATAASSDNDFFLNDTDIALAVKQRGNFIGINFYYTYNGDDDDIRFFVLDQDDNELTQSDEYIKAASTATRFSTSVFVPSDDTGLRYGFQVVTGNSSKVFIVDDIEFSTNPFVYKELEETQSEHEENTDSSLSSNLVLFSGTNHVIAKSNNLITIDTASGHTKFISNSNNVVFNIHAYITQSASTARIHIRHYDSSEGTTEKFTDSTFSGTGYPSGCTGSVVMDSGDYVEVFSDSIAATRNSGYSFTATTTAEHVVTPAKSTLTDWESYTPTTQGFGTVTNMDARWRRVGDTIEVKATWNNGTVAASEAQFGLPNSYTVGDGSTEIVGTWGRAGGGSAQEHGGVALATDGDAFVNISDRAIWSSTGKDTLTPANGNRTGTNSEKMSIEFSVQVSELTSDATFLAAVPKNYFQKKDLQADKASSQALTDLNFNNLVPGKVYRLTASMDMDSNTNTTSFSIEFTHNSAIILKVQEEIFTSISKEHVFGNSVIFEASASTITAQFNRNAGTLRAAQTYAILEELNYTEETTRFS